MWVEADSSTDEGLGNNLEENMHLRLTRVEPFLRIPLAGEHKNIWDRDRAWTEVSGQLVASRHYQS